MARLSLRLPSGGSRAVIAAAGLAVIALFIAVYGNARARGDNRSEDHLYNPLVQPGWDATHRASDVQIPR